MNNLYQTNRRLPRILVALALLSLSACPPLPGPHTDAAADASAGKDLATAGDLTVHDGPAGVDLSAVCPTAKIAFTQAEGCLNDGSNEFCVPKGDAATLLEVKRIAPTVTCGSGGGRAGCDLATQQLCFLPTDGHTCLSPHGALTDAAWAQHCQLAALPAVPKIVHTVLE